MCDTPRLARYTGQINPKTGKPVIKFIPPRVDGGDYEYFKMRYGSDLLLLPCGSCPSCLKQYSFEWSVRLMAESLYHEDQCFLTLTYDDKHLPRVQRMFDRNGEVLFKYHPLVKKDLQDFFKRLRKHFPDVKIRYFACGEYGENPLNKTEDFSVVGRPHYHCILFGLKFDDAKILFFNKLSQPIATSEILDSIWQKGQCSIGEVTAESCGYVARYSLKKRFTGNNAGEFVLMSRMPGIGYQFFQDHKADIYLTDRVYNQKFVSSKPPRFFDKLADSDEDIIVNYRYELSKQRRNKMARGKEYLNMIAFQHHHIEEAQVMQYARGLKGMTYLRRSLC